MTKTAQTFNRAKFEDLVLYVVARLAGDPHNGTIKRNKVLAFAEFDHFAKYGQTITGAVYAKQPYGPAPRGIKQIEQDLIQKGRVAQVVVGYGRNVQKLLFPIAGHEPDPNAFTGREVASIEAALDLLEGKTGMESSDLAHDRMLGWQFAALRDDIPPPTVFLYAGPVTDDDVTAAKELWERMGDEIERQSAAPAHA